MAEAAASPRPATPARPASPAASAKKSPLVQAAASPKLSTPAGGSPAASASAKKSPVLQARSPVVAKSLSPLIKAAASPQLAAAAGSPASAKKSPRTAPAAAPSPPADGKAEAKTDKAEKPKKKAEPSAPMLPASASREDNLQYDLKHMAAYDIAVQSAKTSEADFLAYTRDSVQLLVNKIFSLPRSREEEGVVVELPQDEVFRLPRQKPIPKAAAQTRFQKFMQNKDMKKRKRSRLVFDEVSGDWKPRWGYRSVKKSQEPGKMGIYETKAGEDPNANPFERMKAEKKLLMMRQKMREVRNKVEAAGGKMRASVPDLTRDGMKRGKDGLKEALRRAQVASGSRGKFDRVAPNEATNLQPKRARIHEPMSGAKEKDRYMKFAGKVLSGETVDKDKAAKAGRQMAQGTKVPKKQKVKGIKGTPGKGRRSKQGGRDKAKKGGKKKGKGKR